MPQEKTSNTEDGEEQLDFEAEEGECIEPKQNDQQNGDTDPKGSERGNCCIHIVLIGRFENVSYIFWQPHIS